MSFFTKHIPSMSIPVSVSIPKWRPNMATLRKFFPFVATTLLAFVAIDIMNKNLERKDPVRHVAIYMKDLANSNTSVALVPTYGTNVVYDLYFNGVWDQQPEVPDWIANKTATLLFNTDSWQTSLEFLNKFPALQSIIVCGRENCEVLGV